MVASPQMMSCRFYHCKLQFCIKKEQNDLLPKRNECVFFFLAKFKNKSKHLSLAAYLRANSLKGKHWKWRLDGVGRIGLLPNTTRLECAEIEENANELKFYGEHFHNEYDATYQIHESAYNKNASNLFQRNFFRCPHLKLLVANNLFDLFFVSQIGGPFRN